MSRIIQNRDYLANRIELARLKMQRCIDRLDWHDATIAEVQMQYWQERLAELDGKPLREVCDRFDYAN